jgi:ATP-dependent RNA helicase RhlB
MEHTSKQQTIAADQPLLTDIAFSSLDLVPSLRKGVEQAGFEYCTSIQAKTLPLALAGRDIEGQAQTGTGKTAAFLLAAMNHILRAPPGPKHKEGDPRVLILAPTRELAIQIHKDAESLGAYTGLRMSVVYGGTAYEAQRDKLAAGVDLLIGTPGRIIDYYKQRVFSLRGIQVVVLDEADRMFDLGFIKDLRFLLRRLPPPAKRLNLLFSATLSFRVSELAYEHMNAPTIVDMSSDQVTVANVHQILYHVAKDEKISLLLGLLQHTAVTRALVFVNTKRAAESVTAYLAAHSYQVGMLSGDVLQRKRLSLLEQFRQGTMPILVATDVAARGLHIPEVTHVINYDLPQDPEDYVHRIGRTARAGATGHAISFACEEYVYSLPEIEAFIGHGIPTEHVNEDLLAPVKQAPKRQRSAAAPPPGRRKRRSTTARPAAARGPKARRPRKPFRKKNSEID